LASALALHVLLFGLMFAGLWWTRTANPVSAAGPVIEADLIDPDALAAPLRRALDAPADAPPPQAPPEPEPDPAPPEPEQVAPPPEAQPQPQDFVPEPDLREQERVERDAEAARQAAAEQEERRRQEQIDLTERKRQQEAERQARAAKQKEIADKLAKIRAERAKAERQAKLAEQKLRQIEDARSRNAAEAAAQSDAAATASPPPGNEGVDADLLGRYVLAIQRAVAGNWDRTGRIPPGAACRVLITQLPGGRVISATADASCPYDELGRRSVETAVLKAQPLPYAGFEPVFRRQLLFTFHPPDE
jgi:colicin import membrane protein